MLSRFARIVAGAGLALVLAAQPATLTAGSAPDPQRLHQPRTDCHVAYDRLINDLDKGAAISADEEAWARAHENASNAPAPCPAPPQPLLDKAVNHVISTPDGLKIARRFIDRQKDASAMLEVGLSVYSGFFSDLPKSQGLDLIRASATGGDPMGMYIYGTLLAQGGYGTKDIKGGVRMMEQAAAAGHVDAMHRAGIYYHEGVGVKKDEKTAFDLFRQAAERGHVYSTIMAFTMISEGRGTKKDFDLAYRLSRSMAEQGEVYGAVMAASSLLQSKDAMKYETEVLYWMDYAIRNGDDSIRSQMTPLRTQAAAIYSRPAAPPRDYRPRPFKACPMKTVCTVNHYSGLRSCTTNKDYWNDCDG
ncbi:MAG: sel1 repeat family protein [Blastomonas sp.]|uniref:tetratricopeptide repeat protein n=1 Tax=Blastomonas sp. TaxID=1909299 RepID=UPI00258AE3E7|nr:tetratricopeptide repeat protein [Blastomonas sp.]MCO5794550.1 sel1 repeat family protein [Blastomonas sp.]